MRKILSAAVAAAAIVGFGAAFAQTPPSDSSAPPAIATDHGDSRTTVAPVSGKNSFTESEARSRLEKHGYSNVSPLAQDEQSIWRGTAIKDGKTLNVAVDYQGNIVDH
ncbi:MAG: hypothetical protein QOJ54_287 [Aliidongia sp.]|jgi:hypothetical protein|nr:hypothetical protein [Aliidongia sp.]